MHMIDLDQSQRVRSIMHKTKNKTTNRPRTCENLRDTTTHAAQLTTTQQHLRCFFAAPQRKCSHTKLNVGKSLLSLVRKSKSLTKLIVAKSLWHTDLLAPHANPWHPRPRHSLPADGRPGNRGANVPSLDQVQHPLCHSPTPTCNQP